MIKAFAGATVWSADINNLLPFYRDTLGLKPGVSTPEFVVFGDQTAPALAIGTHSEVKGPNSDPARHMIGFNVEGISGVVDGLKAKGVEFIEEPTDYDGLMIATLKDPEGNLIQLYEFRPQ